MDYNASYHNRMAPLRLVAVHLGAGDTKNAEKAKEFAKSICEEIMLAQQDYLEIVTDGSASPSEQSVMDGLPFTAESAAVQLVQRMEDNPDLNCGQGSNLNMHGEVECDAGFMSSRTRKWCGVGAVSGCKNPIVLAKSLHDHQTISRPLGLVQPNLLVGSSGPKQWMQEHCPQLIVAKSKLISPEAFARYQRLKSRYDHAVRAAREVKNSPVVVSDPPELPTKRLRHHSDETSKSHVSSSSHRPNQSSKISNQTSKKDDQQSVEDGKTESYDTVGAIAVDFNENYVSAISSGGVLLKYKGRLGQAAVPGAGCWASENVAVTTTGVGEYLTANVFAKNVCEVVQSMRLDSIEEVHEGIDDKLDLDISKPLGRCLDSLWPARVPKADRLAGLLAVSVLNDYTKILLTYGHSTNTMCIGYMTYNDVAGHSIMSKQECKENIGEPLVNTIKFHNARDWQDRAAP